MCAGKMAETSILLRNATILVPSKGGSRITPLKAHSLLIQGNVIARIASHIDPPSDNTTIIDCTGKLVSPGFIDTHHHVWQTQLKGRHADHTLVEYMPTGDLSKLNHIENGQKLINLYRKHASLPLHTRGYLLGGTGRTTGSPKRRDNNHCRSCSYELLDRPQ